MNNYVALRKANRMRMQFLSKTSQQQVKDVIRYLMRTSWDFCGVELVRSDLIDMAIQANENGQELFQVLQEEEIFAHEVKPSLKTLRAGDYFWFAAPLYFFFGWGVEGLILYPLVPDWVFELSLGYLMQLVVAIAAFCCLFRRVMEQAGFPPREHRIKYIGWLVLYIAALYGTGWCFTKLAGSVVLLRLPVLPYAVFSLLLGTGLCGVQLWRYGNDPRLTTRV